MDIDTFLSGSGGLESRAVLQAQLTEHQQHLAALPTTAPIEHRAAVLMDIAEALIGLERKSEAWDLLRPLLTPLVEAEAWQDAADLCEQLYRTEHDDAIRALGHGAWLAVTYPVRPQSSITLLEHIIDETPEKADGAAVAAMLAHYLAGLRAEGQERDSLLFLTTQIISRVALRHRGIEDQDTLDTWIEMYQLNDIPLLLQRMGKILDAIVGPTWWFDRDALRERLPVN